MLISDQQYWVFDGESFFAPQPLSSLGLPDYVDKLDDAFVWGKNGKTYFFYQNLYWRFNEATKTMDSGKAIEILFVLVDVFLKSYLIISIFLGFRLPTRHLTLERDTSKH